MATVSCSKKSNMRKFVIAKFNCFAKFKIPKHIDLEDDAQVESWYVSWGELHIELTNGKRLTIQEDYGLQETDFQTPESEEIEEREDEEEAEDEEDEEDGQDCRGCQNFIPDGEEHVAPESSHAYCRNCVQNNEELYEMIYPQSDSDEE